MKTILYLNRHKEAAEGLNQGKQAGPKMDARLCHRKGLTVAVDC
jgi:hypothetical protein